MNNPPSNKGNEKFLYFKSLYVIVHPQEIKVIKEVIINNEENSKTILAKCKE